MNSRQTGFLMGNIQALALWVPVGFFLIGAALISMVWSNAQRNDRMRLQTETEVTAEQVKLRLEAWIDSRAAVVQFFAQNFGADPVVDSDRFRQNASVFLDLYPGFQALNFIDRGWVIRLICPASGNQAALDSDLHRHPAEGVVEALGRAQATGAITRTPLVNLLQGKPGFATYCPLVLPGVGFAGFINGVFSVEGLVDECLGEENLHSRFQIGLFTPDGKEAYKTRGRQETPWPAGFTVEYPLRVVDRNWLLRMAPSPESLGEQKLGPDEFLAGGGLLLSLMLAFLLRAYLLRVVELRNSREGYRLLVDNVADMVIQVRLDGRISFSSPSFWRFLGLSEPDVPGRASLPDFTHPDDVPSILTARARIQEGSQEEDFEVRVMTPAGYRWTGWSGSAFLNEHGELEGIVGVGRDIHARRELEEQLLRSQKLQAVGQLAGGIAHDFNNIIQAIQGYIELASEDLPRGSESRGDLIQALLAADRAAKLTRQLLAFSSRQVMKPIKLDLHGVIHEMAPMLKSMFGESIALEFDLAADRPVITADPGQIEQILMNLCVNSRDAISGAGRVAVETAPVTFTAEDCLRLPWARPGRWVLLNITDDGMGMDQAILGKVFEPFFTTKDPGKGTGLGLATVYGIVKQHGGLVHIQSDPGQGTQVSVYLPLTDGQDAEAECEPRVPEAGKGETILVVEDQDQVRELCARILGQAGYTVLTAEDGLLALRVHAEHRDSIALVLLDLILPGLDGRAVQAGILAAAPGTRILLMSGYDPDSAKERESAQGPQDILTKPFSREDLLIRVRQVLDRTPPA